MTATTLLTAATLTETVDSFISTFGRAPTVLFDADNVLYPWEAAFVAHYHRTYPHLPRVTEPFRDFGMRERLSDEQHEALIASLKTFDYAQLRVAPDAPFVVRVLLNIGVDVAVVTSHTTDNQHCATEKVNSIHRDFDGALDTRLVITRDKTRVFGDFLVDDKPTVTGVCTPAWKHIHYLQRYNADLAGTHLTWADALDVLNQQMQVKVAEHT